VSNPYAALHTAEAAVAAFRGHDSRLAMPAVSARVSLGRTRKHKVPRHYAQNSVPLSDPLNRHSVALSDNSMRNVPTACVSHAQVLTTLANSFPSLTPDFLSKVVKDALTKCASAGTVNARVTSPQPAAAFTPGSTGTPAPLETAKKANSEPSLLEEKLDVLFGNA
jgi:hypothetical protein